MTIRPYMSKDCTKIPDISPAELHKIMEDYAYDDDIMNTEDERSLAIKRAMTKLPEADRIIFCLYLEFGSSRKLAKFLGGIHHSTALKEVSKIKEKILYYLKSSNNLNHN